MALHLGIVFGQGCFMSGSLTGSLLGCSDSLSVSCCCLSGRQSVCLLLLSGSISLCLSGPVCAPFLVEIPDSYLLGVVLAVHHIVVD